MVKAAQWSKPEIKSISLVPADQPISGMKAWNAPKDVAIFRAVSFVLACVSIPFAIDTLRASSARLMATANSVGASILFALFALFL